MLNCIPRSKTDDHASSQHPSHSKIHLTKSISSQFKEMALKASGTFRHAPQPKHKDNGAIDSDSASASGSERLKWSSDRRTATSSNSMSLKHSSSGRGLVFVEESKPTEWVAQVDSGVLITFVSLVGGGNHLKRIRFSKEMYDNMRAQIWWTDNLDRVIELYNVQKLDRQAFPPPAPPTSEDENTVIETRKEIPAMPQLNIECLPRPLRHPTTCKGIGYSSSDSLDQHSVESHCLTDSSGLTSTPKEYRIGEGKADSSSVCLSKTTGSSIEEGLSASNTNDLESEWVEEDEPGVYVTIKGLSDGTREIKRIRFSRRKFGEMPARVWWEENRKRVHKQYLLTD